ncbi:MAG: DUF1194 domain-containing protein [Alphaproteobacteria bacterium]|nr:DUF1194 domain-containing protein [Alphaproteobacteria bacterium]
MWTPTRRPKQRGRARRGSRCGAPFCIVAASLLTVPALAETAVDLELAIGVDVSRSIDAEEAKLQRQGYIKAFRDPEVINAIETGMLGRIAVGYYEWAGLLHGHIVVDWTRIEDATSAHAFADALARDTPLTASRTSISGAIDFAQPWFDNNGFEGNRRVIDVSGDGPNNWGELVTKMRDRAVAAGVTINGLPILDVGGGLFSRFNIANLDLYYRDCVIGGTGAFLVVAADFNDFARAVRRKLVLEIAGLQPPIIPAQINGPIKVQANQPARVSPPCDIGETMWRNRDGF